MFFSSFICLTALFNCLCFAAKCIVRSVGLCGCGDILLCFDFCDFVFQSNIHTLRFIQGQTYVFNDLIDAFSAIEAFIVFVRVQYGKVKIQRPHDKMVEAEGNENSN